MRGGREDFIGFANERVRCEEIGMGHSRVLKNQNTSSVRLAYKATLVRYKITVVTCPKKCCCERLRIILEIRELKRKRIERHPLPYARYPRLMQYAKLPLTKDMLLRIAQEYPRSIRRKTKKKSYSMPLTYDEHFSRSFWRWQPTRIFDVFALNRRENVLVDTPAFFTTDFLR